jgi:hypothetical protein
MVLPFQSTTLQSPPVLALEQGGDKFNLGGGGVFILLKCCMMCKIIYFGSWGKREGNDVEYVSVL